MTPTITGDDEDFIAVGAASLDMIGAQHEVTPSEVDRSRIRERMAQLRMVAAQDWDIAGAMRAGCAGAYLLRSGMVLNPVYPKPDFAEADLHRLAERIVAAEMGGTS